jgi:hypothetical protein
MLPLQILRTRMDGVQVLRPIAVRASAVCFNSPMRAPAEVCPTGCAQQRRNRLGVAAEQLVALFQNFACSDQALPLPKSDEYYQWYAHEGQADAGDLFDS